MSDFDTLRTSAVSMRTAILRGDKAALELAKSTLTNPSIVSTNPPWAITLENVSHVQSSTAEVSEMPILISGKDVKSYHCDNVAPQSWQWQVSGYIPGLASAELTNVFTPIVMKNVDFLRNAYENGSRIIFKDVDQHIYTNCVIQSLSIETKADVKNKKPFTMTLKQLVEIKAEAATMTAVQQAGAPSGSATDAGVTSSEAVDTKKVSDLKILKRLLTGQKANRLYLQISYLLSNS